MTTAAGGGFAARAADLLDAAPVAALFLDPATGEALAGNAEAALLLGCPAEALPAAWARAVGDNAALRRRLAAVQATSQAELFDTHLLRAAAPPEAVLVRARRIVLEGRAVLTVGLVPIFRRHQAEAALAQVSRRLEVALAGADLGAWIWNGASRLIEVTPRWAAMLGLPPPAAGLPESAWESLVHPDDLPLARSRFAALQASETEVYEVELRLRHAAGHWVWIRTQGRALERDAGGRPLAVAGTHLDLTEQRRAAEARAESEREARRRLHDLEGLYRTAPLGLAQLDPELRFVRINEAMAGFNGFPVEAHLGRRFWELVPDVREALEPLLRHVVAAGESLTGIEISGETDAAPGIRRDWVEQLYPVHDPETGAVTGIGVICEEVTERRRADRARELLLRELDHRVKNLFAIIAGLVVFTARSAPSPEAMRATLTGRIQALAQAHDLVRPAFGGALTMQPGGTGLEALARALLQPFRSETMAERLVVSGPPVRLGPTAAPPLALALHEMANQRREVRRPDPAGRAGGAALVDGPAPRPRRRPAAALGGAGRPARAGGEARRLRPPAGDAELRPARRRRPVPLVGRRPRGGADPAAGPPGGLTGRRP